MIGKKDFNNGLLGFLDSCITPFHTVVNVCGMLENAGFIRLDERDIWELCEGKRYFVTRDDSSIVAFNYTKRLDYVLFGAHSDFPTLKLKPNPILNENGIKRFGVEVYGGALLGTWFDRDLSLAGMVGYENQKGVVKNALIDIKNPIATIPSLAIHLDDKANKDKTINKQTDINPIFSTKEKFDLDEFLKNYIDDAKEIYAKDLSFYDTQKASFIGMDEEFIASGRLDNLLSCYVGLLGICSVDENVPAMLVINDKEEVGSQSANGADGSFLKDVLLRMCKTHENYVRFVRSSFFISADNAHAIHPNFASKHEPNHTPHLNSGVVVKVNASHRYTSSSKSISKFLHVVKNMDENVQYFTTRGDMGCGSTIGPITASKIGIQAIDIGVPTFAMHSIREICGSDDVYSFYKIFLGFFDV